MIFGLRLGINDDNIERDGMIGIILRSRAKGSGRGAKNEPVRSLMSSIF